MNQNQKCPNCGGQVAPLDYVCDYCGNVMFNKIRTTDNADSENLTFDEGISIVKQNLDTLHDIPKPSFGGTLTATARVLIALYTFGISLIFWKRPKKRFNKTVYDKLKFIIIRNISFLKISSKGSTDLMSRIQVLDNELEYVDKQIKKALLSKTIAYIFVFVLYVSWFLYILNLEQVPHSSYRVTAYDTLVEGNLQAHIYIVPDTFIISHGSPSGGTDWEMGVKLKFKKLENINYRKVRFKLNLFLTDEQGIPIAGFKPAELASSSKDLFRSQINSPTEKSSFFRFNIKYNYDFPEYKDTIPVNAVKFIIRADSIYPKY